MQYKGGSNIREFRGEKFPSYISLHQNRVVEESGQPRWFWEPEHAVIASASSNLVYPTKINIEMADSHPREQHNLLFEYYDRISKPQDNDVLGNWQVWIYGSDREAYTPHCHIRLPKGELEFEVSLLTWDVINIKNSNLPNSWDSIDRDIRDGFFEWLTRPNKTDTSISNRKYMYYMWDGLNTENTLNKWVKEEEKDRLDDDLLDCLGWLEWSIPIEELIKSIFDIVLPLYQKDSRAREELHHIASFNPIDFAKQVGLPFEFTKYSATNKVKEIIRTYENMCFELSKN